jgi:hypothetical protein
MPGCARTRCRLYFETRTDRYRLRIPLCLIRLPAHRSGSWTMLNQKRVHLAQLRSLDKNRGNAWGAALVCVSRPLLRPACAGLPMRSR